MLSHSQQVMPPYGYIFVMLKWYKLLYYKEILSIYWMTLVCVGELSNRRFYPQADTLRLHLTLTLWVQCIVHLRSTF